MILKAFWEQDGRKEQVYAVLVTLRHYFPVEGWHEMQWIPRKAGM